jgi:hypothetical protein
MSFIRARPFGGGACISLIRAHPFGGDVPITFIRARPLWRDAPITLIRWPLRRRDAPLPLIHGLLLDVNATKQRKAAPLRSNRPPIDDARARLRDIHSPPRDHC